MPSISIALDYQSEEFNKVMQRKNILVNANYDISLVKLKYLINNLMINYKKRLNISRTAQKLVDGNGLQRVVNAIENYNANNNTRKNFSSNKIKPYIIAEIGSNFDQDFEKALKLINVARDAGADAVKFQLFKANHLYPNKDGLYKVFKSIELNPNWLSKLKNYAEKLNLDFIVSPFDKKSVDELDRVKLKIYKIASSEATNLDLINYIAKKRKPIIFSTGMCEMIDVEEAVGVIESYQNKLISILQCVSEYPLKISKTNLNVIELYKNRFSYPVGFSDHTLDSISAVTAVGLAPES